MDMTLTLVHGWKFLYVVLEFPVAHFIAYTKACYVTHLFRYVIYLYYAHKYYVCTVIYLF